MTEKSEPKPPTTSKNLGQVDRKINEDIANSQADVTHDGGRRSTNWTPYLVDPDEQENENPYGRK